MNKEACEKCFDQLEEKGNKLFDKIEQRGEKVFDRMEKRHNVMVMIEIFLFGLFALGIAASWAKTYNVQTEKVDKIELTKYLTIKQAVDIHKVRDAYYNDRFLLNPKSKIDSTNYNLILQTLFGNTSRSIKINNN